MRVYSAGSFLLFGLLLLAAAEAAVLLNVPVLRPALGFLLLTLVPGLLLLHILKLNRLGMAEKVVLSVGLSIAFLMSFGLLFNEAYLALGYEKPLSALPLAAYFGALLLILGIIAYIRNREALFTPFDLRLKAGEKAFLAVPALFPLLSILGMLLMNSLGNNSLLMMLLFLIPAYIAFVAIRHRRVPPRVYPAILFSVSISLLLLLSLRSGHLIGSDTHIEYYLFQLTSSQGHWEIFMGGTLDSCLSISLLPAVYQSFMNIDPEFLFKTLYALILSVAPLAVYVLSRKYVSSLYAFLASAFFISQFSFLWTAANARTNTAVFFFSLAIMSLFHKSLSQFHRRLLFAIFAAGSIVSHYSTTYLFLFLLLFTLAGMWLLSRLIKQSKGAIASEDVGGSRFPASPGNHRRAPRQAMRLVTSVGVVLFFAMLFFWYSQATGAAFTEGLQFMDRTLASLNQFFVLESRGAQAAAIMGQGLLDRPLPEQIEFVVSWLAILLIGLGALGVLVRHRSALPLSSPARPRKTFLRSRLDMEYFLISLAAIAILAFSVAFPFVLKGYSTDRAYFQMMAILSPFFILGGVAVTRVLRVKPYWMVLAILIPYLMCTTGTIYQVLGFPKMVTLNSQGSQYDYLYTHDQETEAARWLKENTPENAYIYTDHYGADRLASQGGIPDSVYAESFIEKKEPISKEVYLYIRYSGAVKGKLMDNEYQWHDVAEYEAIIANKDRIYTNGGSEVYK